MRSLGTNPSNKKSWGPLVGLIPYKYKQIYHTNMKRKFNCSSERLCLEYFLENNKKKTLSYQKSENIIFYTLLEVRKSQN